MSEVPGELLYNADHDWVLVDDGVGICGITDYAQGELGDIVFVELPEVDEDLEAEEAFSTIESVKAASDIFMPVSGTITEQNEALEDRPELINESPYTDGWIIKIKMSNPAELDSLLSASDYKQAIGE